MLKNDEILEEFKKSLIVTTKSISKNNQVEINFTKEKSSINGNLINLSEPNIQNIKKNLTYIRAEADALALEFRFHSKEIHNNFIDDNAIANEIFNAVEQSRVEAKGSISFKGIKTNITKKHLLDIKKNSLNKENKIPDAFKYVAYEQFLDIDLGDNNKINRDIIKEKLGNNYKKIFKDLKNSLNNQEDFGIKIKKYLDDYGFYEHNENTKVSDDISQENDVNSDENKNKEDSNQNNDEKNPSKIETDNTTVDLQQASSSEETEERRSQCLYVN